MLRLDLLHEASSPRKYTRRQKQMLTFCFARGQAEEELLSVCAPPIPTSSFAQECFAQDLFLKELLSGCFPLVAEGRRFEPYQPFLQGLLVAPPPQSSLLFRQATLRELSKRPGRRQSLEAAYLALREFRRSLSSNDALGGKISHLRRRVDILINLRRAVEALAELGKASDSPLGRAGAWADELQKAPEYQQLETLLNFEDRRTVIESLIQVGYDGTLRRFEIVRATTTSHSAFPSHRVLRFFRRVVSLLRGYRFSDEDIMSQLLDQVFSDLEQQVVELVGCSLELEFYLCSLGFREYCESRGQKVCLPTFHLEGSGPRRLRGLFNPWLLAQGIDAVPCHLDAPDAQVTTIVTGPNSGGKTRLLQALAVTQLLGQVGSFIPAEAAELVWVRQLFLSLLEHVDAGQAEGRLGMELLRIRRVFEASGQSSLIIMDELCSGTNPSEGEQIFEMVLDLLRELRPQVIISTHFLDFAERLRAPERVDLTFLQVELGPREVPTYRFVPGIAKTSLARATAARLGVTRDELLALVEEGKARSVRTEPS